MFSIRNKHDFQNLKSKKLLTKITFDYKLNITKILSIYDNILVIFSG